MRNHVKLLVILIIGLFLIVVGCSTGDDSDDVEATTDEEATEENETSEEVEAEEEDYNLVATTVALVEILDELDIDLVGVPTSYKELPERYADAVEVGMAAEPDMEIIKSLKPDDVLSATTLDAEFDLAPVFESADVPVTFVDMEGIENMYETIEELAEEYDRQEQAEAIITEFEEKVVEIEEKIEGQESPEVLILLGIPGSYLVATENSFLGDVVKRAGGTNVFPGEEGIEYASANTEHLQQTNPDIILRAAHGMPDAVVEMFDEEFAENDIWQHFDAVQNDEVYDLEEELFGTTADLAVVEALDHLVELFYPDL